MSIKKYSYLFVFLLVFISSLLAMVNYVIDPYMLFQSKRIAGFNDKKPTVANRSTLYKPYNVVNIKPNTIIIGNSRPEMGLDPNSACWPNNHATVYSLTFPGVSFYGQIRALYHGIATGRTKQIVLGIDFADFLHPKREFSGDFWPKKSAILYQRFLVDEQFTANKSYWLNKTKDYATALFSLDALNDSVTTLISQSPNSANRTQLGFNPAKDYHEIIRYEGAWVLFAQKKKELQQRFSKPNLTIFDTENWSFELEALKKAIQLAHTKNINLTLFINAYHYTYLETIKNAGYWSEFEQFKRSLLATVQQYGNNNVALWDFALYSHYTVAAIPQKNTDKTDWHWFWEPAHYKAELGELMLADMFATACVANKKEAVGIKLNTVNIDTHLLRQQQQRAVLLQNLL